MFKKNVFLKGPFLNKEMVFKKWVEKNHTGRYNGPNTVDTKLVLTEELVSYALIRYQKVTFKVDFSLVLYRQV